MKRKRDNHDRGADSVLEGIRCAQCTWCSEIQARRRRMHTFWVGALLGAGLLFAFVSVIHW